jgi:hypothetical protein
MPQAIAWNIGTTGIALSRSVSPMPLEVVPALACSQIERWEYSTPFGLPVVPVV